MLYPGKQQSSHSYFNSHKITNQFNTKLNAMLFIEIAFKIHTENKIYKDSYIFFFYKKLNYDIQF